jgi:hypothetical protein
MHQHKNKSSNKIEIDTSELESSDPQFGGHIRPQSDRAWDLFREVDKQLPRTRAAKSKDDAKLRPARIAVVANLIYHHLCRSPGNGVHVPRAKKELGGRPTRYQPFVFPRSFRKMLDAYCSAGFAVQTIGNFEKHKRTTIRAGAKLVALIKKYHLSFSDLETGGANDEIIILKRPRRGYGDAGAKMDYKDSQLTNKFRDELRAINEWLETADVHFDGGKANYSTPVDERARRLYRIFTMGRFDCGGRLFGGFWQGLPKTVRLAGLRIEGDHVVSLDFSQLNPRLAYSWAKAIPPNGDAYTLPGLEQHRDGVKKIFNAMLFGAGKQFPKGTRALFPKKIRMADVTNAIMARHPQLKGCFSLPRIGHRLQFLESEIMMRILRSCKSESIIALPVFDCVVVKAALSNSSRSDHEARI